MTVYQLLKKMEAELGTQSYLNKAQMLMALQVIMDRVKTKEYKLACKIRAELLNEKRITELEEALEREDICPNCFTNAASRFCKCKALTEDNQEGWSGYVEQPDKLKMMQELEQHKQESKKMCECKDIDVSMWNVIMIRKCKDCGKLIKEDKMKYNDNNEKRKDIINTHITTLEVYKCSYCGKIFKCENKNGFAQHLKSHNKKIFQDEKIISDDEIYEYAEIEQGIADLCECGDR